MKITKSNRKAIILVFLCLFLEGAVMAVMAATKDVLFSHYDITTAQMGILFTLRSLSSVVLLAFTGTMSDKFGRKPILLIGAALFIAYCMMVPSLPTYFSAIISAILFGASYAFMDPSAQTLLFDTLGDPTPIMPYIQVAFAAGGMLSPIIVNQVLKNNLSWKTSYYVLAALAVLILVYALVMKFPTRDFAKAKENISHTFKIPPKVFPDGMFLFLIVLFSGSIQGITTTWADLYAREVFSVSIANSVLVFSYFQIGCIIGALLSPNILKKIHVSKVILGCTCASLLAILATLFAPTYFTFSLFLALTGLASSSVLSICIGYAGVLFYKNSGTAASVIGMANALSFVICSYISGIFIDSIGSRNVFMSLIFTVAMAVLLSVLMLKRHKNIVQD